MRIVITGPPKAGKTRLADTIGRIFSIPIYHTDSLLEAGLEWSAMSDRVATWFDEPGDWIIEGVVVPRGLRKWRTRLIEQNADPSRDQPNFDKFVMLRNPQEELMLQGQRIMAKQVTGLAGTYKEWIGPRWVEL